MSNNISSSILAHHVRWNAWRAYHAHAPPVFRQQCLRRAFSGNISFQNEESRLPRLATTTFWTKIIPKGWRKSRSPKEAAAYAAERALGADDRRAGIVFLVLGIVVGSNAIHLLNMKREMLNFTRQTDAKIAALREVIQRVKNGEDVDVKRILGTGDAEHEQEWEQVIQELETTDMLWEGRKKREAKRSAERQDGEEKQKRVTNESSQGPKTTDPDNTGEAVSEAKSRGPRFMM